MRRASAALLLCLAVSIPGLATAQPEAPASPEAPAVASDEPSIEVEEIEELHDLSPEVIEKLDPETLAEILEMREAKEIIRAARGGMPFGTDLTGLAAVVGVFFTPFLIVVTVSTLQYRKQRQLQETLRLMIEKGAEIPPELLAPPESPHKDLRRGLILVGVGLGLVLLIGLTAGFDVGAWAVGLIPAFIGAAYLIVWHLSRRSESH